MLDRLTSAQLVMLYWVAMRKQRPGLAKRAVKELETRAESESRIVLHTLKVA